MQIVAVRVGFKVGNGKDVRLWLDDWVGVRSLCGLFPILFRLVANKESYVRAHLVIPHVK